MNMRKLFAVIFIIIGTIGLIYGGFSYTSDVHKADIGSLHMAFSEQQHVNIPIWAGVSFICVGGALLLIGRKL